MVTIVRQFRFDDQLLADVLTQIWSLTLGTTKKQFEIQPINDSDLFSAQSLKYDTVIKVNQLRAVIGLEKMAQLAVCLKVAAAAIGSWTKNNFQKAVQMASERKTFKQIFMMVTINELQNEPFMFSLSELLFAGLQNSPNIYQLLPEFAVLMTVDHSNSCFSTGISMQMKILRMIRDWQRVENRIQTKLFPSTNIRDYLDQPSVLLKPVQISNQTSVAKAAVILMSFDHFVASEESTVDNVDEAMSLFPNYPKDLVASALQTRTFS